MGDCRIDETSELLLSLEIVIEDLRWNVYELDSELDRSVTCLTNALLNLEKLEIWQELRWDTIHAWRIFNSLLYLVQRLRLILCLGQQVFWILVKGEDLLTDFILAHLEDVTEGKPLSKWWLHGMFRIEGRLAYSTLSLPVAFVFINELLLLV